MRANLPFAEEVENGWFRGRSRSRVSLRASFKVSGARHFHADTFTTGDDCELDVAPAMRPIAIEVILAMCVVTINDGNDNWTTRSVRFDLVGQQEEPSWKPRSFRERFLPDLAYFHRRVAARVAARQKAIDLAVVVDSFDGNASLR